MAKFWIVEKGNVLCICSVCDPKMDKKEAKKQIAMAIIEALKKQKKQ